MSELDPRKQTILRAVVFEYVSAAEPVGSELLTQKYQLGVKSATVRNEMADLSDLGYLEQPHTSAGRIPSDQGYRYFVDRLIERREPDASQKQAVQDASSEADALRDLLRDTTRMLSRLTHLLTAAAVVRDTSVTIKKAMVSAMGPQQALLVVVLSNGVVENRILEIPPGVTLETIGQTNRMLDETVAGQTLRWVGRHKAPAQPDSAMEKLTTSLWVALRSISRELSRASLTTEGEEFLFGQPEFQRDAGALSEIIESLKHSDVLYDTLASADQPTTVTIGREHRREELARFSVIRQSFYVGESEAGAIAIIGPTRMKYESSIPLVNFAAKALSDSLTRHFG